MSVQHRQNEKSALPKTVFMLVYNNNRSDGNVWLLFAFFPKKRYRGDYLWGTECAIAEIHKLKLYGQVWQLFGQIVS